jgi:hypothetical protein
MEAEKSKIIISTYVNITMYCPVQILYVNKFLKIKYCLKNVCSTPLCFLDPRSLMRHMIFKYFSHSEHYCPILVIFQAWNILNCKQFLFIYLKHFSSFIKLTKVLGFKLTKYQKFTQTFFSRNFIIFELTL